MENKKDKQEKNFNQQCFERVLKEVEQHTNTNFQLSKEYNSIPLHLR